MKHVKHDGRHYDLLWLDWIEKCRNPVWSWLKKNRPGIVSVVEKLGIKVVGVTNVSWERITVSFFVDDKPIKEADALKLGMTEEELKSFDQQVDTTELISVLDWKIHEYPMECAEVRGDSNEA